MMMGEGLAYGSL